MADVELKGEIKGISIKEEMNKQRTVRISTEAHTLLAEKAVDFNASMKEIASEAVFLMFKEKNRNMAILAVASIVNFGVGFLCGHFIGAI